MAETTEPTTEPTVEDAAVEVCESLLIEIRDILKEIKINIGGA
jgi:hypothetical protein